MRFSRWPDALVYPVRTPEYNNVGTEYASHLFLASMRPLNLPVKDPTADLH